MGDENTIPLATTISEQARALYSAFPDKTSIPANPAADDQAGWHAMWLQMEASEKPRNDAVLARYQPLITRSELAGIPVLDIRPQGWEDNGKILLHTHGGAYTLFSAASSLAVTVPVASDTGLRVISIDYTLAPRAQWQQILNEVLAVIGELQQQGYAIADMAILGESAGGSLANGVALKLRDQDLGLLGAVLLWSPWSDISEIGESYATLRDADPAYFYDLHLESAALAYAREEDHRHPYVSPVYGDYSTGFPPTLIQGGTREIFLSNFVRHYQVIDSADQTVKLDLYEGMPHVFQALDPEMPESKLAREKLRKFLDRYFCI